MSRRMSCSMTVTAVRDRTKTVTRRHIDTWSTLKAGDRLTLIEKGMGLASTKVAAAALGGASRTADDDDKLDKWAIEVRKVVAS